MSGIIAHVREALALRRLRARFPTSVVHAGASASHDSEVGEFAVLFPGAILEGTIVGAYTYVQSRTLLMNAEIGPFCSIASDVTVGLAAHPTYMVSSSPVFYDSAQPLPRFFVQDRVFVDNLPRTSIGADVWMGQRSMVKAGVTIGVGAVIGAAAVVTHDVSAYAIVAGIPARPIRRRFDDDVCERLLASRWWDLPEHTLRECAADFAEPRAFLAALERAR